MSANGETLSVVVLSYHLTSLLLLHPFSGTTSPRPLPFRPFPFPPESSAGGDPKPCVEVPASLQVQVEAELPRLEFPPNLLDVERVCGPTPVVRLHPGRDGRRGWVRLCAATWVKSSSRSATCRHDNHRPFIRASTASSTSGLSLFRLSDSRSERRTPLSREVTVVGAGR